MRGNGDATDDGAPFRALRHCQHKGAEGDSQAGWGRGVQACCVRGELIRAPDQIKIKISISISFKIRIKIKLRLLECSRSWGDSEWDFASEHV